MHRQTLITTADAYMGVHESTGRICREHLTVSTSMDEWEYYADVDAMSETERAWWDDALDAIHTARLLELERTDGVAMPVEDGDFDGYVQACREYVAASE